MRKLFRKTLSLPIVLLIALQTYGQETDSDNLVLVGRWKLTILNEQPVSNETYAQDIPYLEIKEKDLIMSGYTGCNVIHGHYEISDFIVFYHHTPPISPYPYSKSLGPP